MYCILVEQLIGGCIWGYDYLNYYYFQYFFMFNILLNRKIFYDIDIEIIFISAIKYRDTWSDILQLKVK